MKNPLNKRLRGELKSEFGRYFVIFLFIVGTIAIVSGWNVAGNSMSVAYEEGFEKYNIEDGCFELLNEADEKLISELENDSRKIYKNFFIERKTDDVDSTLRIYKKRTEIDLECLMKGDFPSAENEIAIDRMYADNNKLKTGDMLSVDGREYKISGLVALSDYTALYSDPADMMFDAVKFGVAIVNDEGFGALGEKRLHCRYSWKYSERPENDKEAKKLSDKFLETLSAKAEEYGDPITEYIPGYANLAINFAGDDINNDNTFVVLFLYIIIVIIAFIFAITTSNTISKESAVIGTLRATGYTKGEIIRHYMTMPLLVVLAAAVVGNILGYTLFKDFAANMYYKSYSLPTYVTLWNPTAFINTTVVPLLIMIVINFVMLSRKLSLSPLRFLRRDLSRKGKKKAFKLNTKIGIMHRFRLRVIFQNLPNYLTIIFGVFFANTMLFFGLLFVPMLDKYEHDITTNLLAEHQYILKTQIETSSDDAEKYAASTLKTLEGKLKSEEISIYGIEKNSDYIDISFGDGVYLSNAYAEKHDLKKGDKITLKDQFTDKEYSFKVDGIYYYPAALTVFMDRESFNTTFGNPPDSFNGYFSNSEITDIDDIYIATEITKEDLTKTSRQLKLSIGDLMDIFLVFGVVMFILMIYLLSKIIIEKNAGAISMTKILGYENKEINGIYVMTTSIVVVGSLLLTIPIVDVVMKEVCEYFFKSFPGWLPFYTAPSTYVIMAVLGIASYGVIAFFQMKKVKNIPLADALKNAE